MNLSGKRLEYLLYLSRHKEGITQNMLAERFGVSLVTVHKALKVMEEMGLVRKRGQGHCIQLTKLGKQEAAKRMEDLENLFQWMRDDLGLGEIQAETESLKMIGSQDAAVISRIVAQAVIRHSLLVSGGNAQAPMSLSALGNGIYPVGFVTLKKDGASQSMGDRAFRKPAEIAVAEGKGAILLRAKEIRHKSLMGRLMRGSLGKLWYRMDDMWNAAHQGEDGRWVIPLRATEIVKQTDTIYGMICIRAEPTCNFAKMAEHPAYIKLDLAWLKEQIEAEEENDAKFVQMAEKNDVARLELA